MKWSRQFLSNTDDKKEVLTSFIKGTSEPTTGPSAGGLIHKFVFV